MTYLVGCAIGRVATIAVVTKPRVFVKLIIHPYFTIAIDFAITTVIIAITVAKTVADYSKNTARYAI